MFLQGPSLFAYNDALFEAKDWTGIRMLGDSVKEKDPLKVGRFGLGFKSVYHMTGTRLIFKEVPQRKLCMVFDTKDMQIYYT